jgi:AraC-like DNA-binding protein
MKLTAQTSVPPPALRPYVDHYWGHTFPSATREFSSWQQCVPSANVELIFHLDSGRVRSATGQQTIVYPEAYVVGLHSEPVRWQLPGQSSIFGVQMALEGFLRIFRRPLGEVAETHADLRAFVGTAGGELIDLVRNAGSHLQRVELLNRFFLQRLSDPRPGERYLLEAVRALRRCEGQGTIGALSGELFIGTRQLQRAFRDYFGTTPKAYSRVVRFRMAYDFLVNNPKTSWAELSYQFGYTDQSHFIRDFKQFAGTAPTAFLSKYVPYPALSTALSAA